MRQPCRRCAGPFDPFCQRSANSLSCRVWRAAVTWNFGEQSFVTKTRCTCQWGLITSCGLPPQPCPANANGILPHFESLPHFGVWCARGNGGVFPSDWGPVLERIGNVSVLQTTTANMSLLDTIKFANKLGIPTDGFLSGVF